MKRSIFTFAVISSVLLFVGCGQSGPLYLPGNPNKVEKISPATPDEEKKKKENDDASTG